MKYLRTTLGTEWPEARSGRAERVLAAFVPEANPNYRDKWHLIREWYVEFDDDDLPWREIGLESDGTPVVAAPSAEDYGYWLDTNMRFGDFEGEPIRREEFEAKWKESGVLGPE